MRRTTVYKMLDLSYNADCEEIQRQLKAIKLQQEKDILALKKEVNALKLGAYKWVFL